MSGVKSGDLQTMFEVRDQIPQTTRKVVISKDTVGSRVKKQIAPPTVMKHTLECNRVDKKFWCR